MVYAGLEIVERERPPVSQSPIIGGICEICEERRPFVWEWYDPLHRAIYVAHSECKVSAAALDST